uniref:17S U2 SnRNP complex component HTATSF1 n=1 Tax=Plectus sambesii TaxID=2011161 RepID=A0A914W332_9BILA
MSESEEKSEPSIGSESPGEQSAVVDATNGRKNAESDGVVEGGPSLENMQLVGDVWVYTDPETKVHYTHNGTDWVPYAAQAPDAGGQGAVMLEGGQWVHTDTVSGERRVFDDQTKTWIESAAAAAVDDDDDLDFQLQQEKLEKQRLMGADPSNSQRYTDPKDGMQYEWDSEKKAWFPCVDLDFIARYQASYGEYNPENVPGPSGSGTAKKEEKKVVMTAEEEAEKEKIAQMTPEQRKDYFKQQKKEKRRLAAEQEKKRGWVALEDTKNCNIYISGLPADTTDKELEELVQKCGVVQKDPRTNQPKLKLYRDEQGNVKGDARCCYVKFESVELALQILDGRDVRGNKLTVEQAQFEQKGDYDPSKKRKKLTAAQKKRWLERQEHAFDWKPEKPRGARPKSDSTVVLMNTFSLQEFAEDASRMLDTEAELRAECSKYGTVKKVVVYDNNPDGVSTATFDTPEMADDCVTMMNYRVFKGRQLRAQLWDGRTKYRVVETEEQKEERIAKWRSFLDEPTPSAGGE